MADVLFTTMGTWGDLFPLVGVGIELANRGHQTRVGAPPVWRKEVESAGLQFAPLGATSSFREFTDHPEVLKPIPGGLRKAMQWLIFDQIDLLTSQLTEEVRTADVVVTHPAHVAAHNVAEQLNVPRIVTTVFPMMIPSSYTVPAGSRFGPWHGRLGRATNRMAWRFGEAGAAALFDRPINHHRRTLGLPKVKAAMIQLPLRASATVVMAAPVFIEPPSDWPPVVEVTSFVGWDRPGQAVVSTAVENFLSAGTPPVLITLGASGAIEPESFLEDVTNEVVRQGHRALIVTGPAETAIQPGHNVHVAEYVPFSLVGSRCVAAVHHGGVGTTASFLRAGIPQVAIPKGFDQPMTAARIEALGLGRAVPWAKRHKRTGPILQDVLGNNVMRARSRELADLMGPDGTVASADVIERFLERK